MYKSNQILDVIVWHSCSMKDMNSMEIDRNRNVGIINLMKGFAMFSNEIAYSLHNAEFIDSSDTEKSNDRRWILSFLCTAQHIVGLLRGLQT